MAGFQNRLRGQNERDDLRENAGDMGALSRMARPEAGHRPGSWQSERLRKMSNNHALGAAAARSLEASRRLDQTDERTAMARDQQDFNKGQTMWNRNRTEGLDAFNKGQTMWNRSRTEGLDAFNKGQTMWNRSRTEGLDAANAAHRNKTFNLTEENAKFRRKMENERRLRELAKDAIAKQKLGINESRYKDSLSHRNKILKNQEEMMRRNAINELRTKFHPEDVARIMQNPEALERYLSGQALGAPNTPEPEYRNITIDDVMPGERGPIPGPLQLPEQNAFGPQQEIPEVQQQEPFRLRALQASGGRGSSGSGGGGRGQFSYVKNIQALAAEAARSGISQDQLYDENGKPKNALKGLAQYMDKGVPFEVARDAMQLKTDEQRSAEQYQNDKDLAKDSSWWLPDSDEVDAAQDRIAQYERQNPKRALSRKPEQELSINQQQDANVKARFDKIKTAEPGILNKHFDENMDSPDVRKKAIPVMSHAINNHDYNFIAGEVMTDKPVLDEYIKQLKGRSYKASNKFENTNIKEALSAEWAKANKYGKIDNYDRAYEIWLQERNLRPNNKLEAAFQRELIDLSKSGYHSDMKSWLRDLGNEWITDRNETIESRVESGTKFKRK